jgi:hypothetical protein
MSRLDDLPSDQRATLSLLLAQRKSYAEIAALLGIPERAVHDRAHAALAVLAPRQARELTAEQRESIGNYLLGQQAGVAERLATRTSLESSAAARTWAHAIAEQIAPLSSVPLAEIPTGATPSSSSADVVDVTAASASAPEAAPRAAEGPHRAKQPSSRLAGAILLAGIVALVVVAVVLTTGGGGGGSHTAATSESASSTATTSTAPTTSATSTSGGTGATGTGTGPTEVKRLTLTSPDPASKAVGAVEILSEGSKHAFYLVAEHLAPSSGFFYAVWLYNSPTSHEAVSKSPAVGSSGTLQGGALLPANAANYHTMLLTRETTDRPSQPGPIVLSGPFSLG